MLFVCFCLFVIVFVGGFWVFVVGVVVFGVFLFVFVCLFLFVGFVFCFCVDLFWGFFVVVVFVLFFFGGGGCGVTVLIENIFRVILFYGYYKKDQIQFFN